MKQSVIISFKWIILLVLLIVPIVANAKDVTKDKKWKFEIAAGINNYSAWEIEPAITYQPIPYVGITIGALFSDIPGGGYCSGTTHNEQWLWTMSSDSTSNAVFALRPSIQLNTPSLLFGQNKDIALYFTLSPGLTITPFAKNRFEVSYTPNRPGAYESNKLDWKANKRAKFLYAHVKGILSLEIKDFGILSLIYTCSNYDFYGERRNITIEGSRLNFEKKRFTHAVAMGLGYRF